MVLMKLHALITQMEGLVNGEKSVLVLEEEVQIVGELVVTNHFARIQVDVLGEVA